MSNNNSMIGKCKTNSNFKNNNTLNPNIITNNLKFSQFINHDNILDKMKLASKSKIIKFNN